MTVCNFDYREVGPLAQTLFLGCSLSSITMNFAWGSESSTCTVKLAKDTSAHPNASAFGQIDTRLSTILNNNSTESREFDSAQLNMNDPAYTLQKSLAHSEDLREKYRDREDVANLSPSRIKDNGKKCWNVHNLTADPANWVGPDPGFVGDDTFVQGNVFQSIGVPVYFKFDQLEFGGLINKWSYAGGMYDVTIQGPGSILKGCNLILNDYYGSVATQMPNTPATFDGSDISMPSNIYTLPDGITWRPYNSDVFQGNIPNLFNIFGYATDQYGFGALNITEFGISAGQIYDLLVEMLNNEQGIQKNPFNPYGAIVARSLMKYGNQGTAGTYDIINPAAETISFQGSTINLTQLGFLNHKTAVDNTFRPLLRLDLSDVPRPPNGAYLDATSSMSLDEFINFCCEGAGFDWNCEIIPDLASSDFSGRIYIRTYNRNIQTPTKVLRNFVNTFTASDKIISFNLGEAHNSEDKVRKVVVGAKQQRLYQVSSNTLSQFRHINRFDPETMRFTTEGADLAESFLINGDSRNQVREPLAGSTRPWDSSWGPAYRTYGGAVAAQISNDFLTGVNAWSNKLMTKGNYSTYNPSLATTDDVPATGPSTTAQTPIFGPSAIGGQSYPVFLDLISPYFGRHGDGSLRQVFFDRGLKQLWINVALNDILTFFPNVPSSFVGGKTLSICENEMRAAIAGMDSWLTYIFEPMKMGYVTPTGKLIRDWVRHRFGTARGNAVLLEGISVLDNDTKKSALPSESPQTNRINPASKQMYDTQVYPVLQNLHSYIAGDIGSHYGSEYAVRIPYIKRSVDATGKAHYDYEVIDSAWEEFGNFIDDTIQMGSDEAFALAESDGKFGPILGYNAAHEGMRARPERNTDIGSALYKMTTGGRIMTHYKGSVTAPGTWYQPLDIQNHSAEDLIVVGWDTFLIPGERSLGGVPAGTLIPNQFAGQSSATDSFGESIPNNLKYKAYTKASIEDIVPENRTNTKILTTSLANYVVLRSNNPIFLKSAKSAKITLLEDLLHANLFGYQNPTLGSAQSWNLAIPNDIQTWKLMFTLILLNGNTVSSALLPNITANNNENVPISPRAAMPCFAAVPVRYNLSTYGPWSTHPGVIALDIFPTETVTNARKLTNNIIGGVEVDVSESYNPWDYGGMTNLDTAVLANLAEANRYQQVQEEGTIQVANILFQNGNLGSRAINDNGPMINAINVDIGGEGIRSTYHFRSYSRKLGFYNKSQATNAQQFGKERITNRKLIADSRRKTMEAIRQRRQSGRAASSADLPRALSYSPATVLIGGALPLVHKNSLLDNAYTQLGYNPTWNQRPKVPNTVQMNPKDSIFHSTAVSLYDHDEIPSTVLNAQNYPSMSMMSLDGILSPISFYPTAHGTTYPIAFYPRSKCPVCKGQNSYTYKEYSTARNHFDKNNRNIQTVGAAVGSFTTKTINGCWFCRPDNEIVEKKKKSHTPNEMTPPYLIASGTNNQILTNLTLNGQMSAGTINQYTLNPMVMSATGSDFSNVMHKQSNDSCGHSIASVAFGNAWTEPGDGLTAIVSDNIAKNYNDYDINLIAADPTNPQAFQNIRSFGLRGPLMVHAWGYDLEGYPVPNASGELKLNGAGEYVLDNEGNPVGQNQVLQADGTWSAPYKENTFYRGWAQMPTTWPVGPIDLRWDDNAHVWTVGANYKPVWVVLETDLYNDEPVRGIVVESSYSNSPLPSGLKKLVFVKDTLGIFASPRGAALYCRYDSNNGFYEPIYNRPLVTTGTLLGGNSATIYKAYTPSIVSEDEVSSYNTTFTNPLMFDLAAGEVGLFTFIDGNWVLQSLRN